LRPYLKQFSYIKENPLTIHSKGEISLSTSAFKGFIKSDIKLSMNTENKEEVHLSIDNDISVKDNKFKIQTKAISKEFDWDLLSTLWPENMGMSARSWVLKNMIGGSATEGIINFDFLYNFENKSVEIENINGSVGVSDTVVSYLGNLPKIKEASAIANFDHKSFNIKITGGTTNRLKIVNGQVFLYDLDTDTEKAKINLNIQGPVQDALSLADQKPLEFIKPFGINPSEFNGNANIDLELIFPLKSDLEPAEVQTVIQAGISDVDYIYKLQDKDFHISEGDMKLSITNAGLELSGDCKFDKHKSFLVWKKSFKSKPETLQSLKIESTLPFIDITAYTPDAVKNFFSNKEIISSQGETKTIVNYIQKNEKTSSLSLDLDLTNNTFDVMPVNVRIPKSKENRFNALFDFQNGNLTSIKSFNFNTKPIKIVGTTTHNKNGNLENITLKKVEIIDRHIQAKANLENHLLTINAKAEEINLLPLIDLFKGKNKQEKSNYQLKTNINATIKKLLLKENIELPNVAITIKYKGSDPELIKINSQKDDLTFIDLYYGPKEDKTVFDLKTSSLENLLIGFDITKDLSAKLIEIKAEKLINSESPMVGKLKASELRIKNAPILAKLFSLISVESLLSNLTGQGILFVRGTAEYEYKDKKLAVMKGELTSSGIGLTSQGYIDIENNLLDLYGVIIPANILNQAITGIPIIGDILTAGKKDSGIISTSYTIKGNMEDPVVNSNPLSVLAPTFVRRIFSGIFGSKEQEITIKNFPSMEIDDKKIEVIN
jgi:hypothetical protein